MGETKGDFTMPYSAFTEQINLFAKQINLMIPESASEKLYALTQRMLQVNQSMNLTAITEPKQLILRHYIDSLSVEKYLPAHAKVLDMGCGAGFPTFPLAILRSDLQITSLDSTEKKIRYIEETARLLSLPHIHAISGRAEDLSAPKMPLRESFDVVVSRAVARMNLLGELCLPFVKAGGVMIAMKAAKADEEWEEAEGGIAKLGGKLQEKISFSLISDEPDALPEERTLFLIQKMTKTPDLYPRAFAQMKKKPL